METEINTGVMVVKTPVHVWQRSRLCMHAHAHVHEIYIIIIVIATQLAS